MRCRETAGIAVAVMALLAAVAVASPRDVGTGRGSMTGFNDTPGAIRPALPDIDRRIPARTETATFALG